MSYYNTYDILKAFKT